MKPNNYQSDGEPRKCQFCRSKKLSTVVVDTLDGYQILEKKVVCDSCKKEVAYWAYGAWMP